MCARDRVSLASICGTSGVRAFRTFGECVSAEERLSAYARNVMSPGNNAASVGTRAALTGSEVEAGYDCLRLGTLRLDTLGCV